eukprot:CAMPEP_0185194362 /NCGR_PEP_ID=MMETSP1140-20130426/30548_1 /TAXON_ID=298111 /ORGANISM="Pavlova sp., Strain CCMP459" /LENGTH=54 /DNA_ID=CAMNT_0027761285 /DNA_START=83 /DNA_END=243 /DNA_ORIENTATION=+
MASTVVAASILLAWPPATVCAPADVVTCLRLRVPASWLMPDSGLAASCAAGNRL